VITGLFVAVAAAALLLASARDDRRARARINQQAKEQR
jgi:uncharacterized protein involved in outer membrane biogenesis